MNPILVLLKKDFALFLKDKTAIALTFIVPFAMIYLFGQIFHVNSKDPGPSGIPVAVVNMSDNPAAKRLVEALKAEKSFKVLTNYVNSDKTSRPLAEEDLRPLMRADEFRFALVIPKDVVRTDDIGIHLKTYSNPRNEIEAQTVNGLLQKAIFSNVPELLGQSLQARAKAYIGEKRLNQFNTTVSSAVSDAFGGDRNRIRASMENGYFGLRRLDEAVGTPGAQTSSARDVFSKIVKVDNIQVAGNDIKSPQATLLVGGWAIQFLLFALTASATSLFSEKELGIFDRVLSAPVTRGDILWSKFLYGICLGLLQLMILFSAGRLP